MTGTDNISAALLVDPPADHKMADWVELIWIALPMLYRRKPLLVLAEIVYGVRGGGVIQ